MDYRNLKKHFRRGRKAVSPVVATLILIIVAIVGAVAVGLIVSGIGSQTSKNANVGGAQTEAQTEILIGGSTTLYPVVESVAPIYGAANGVQVVVQQGGSGAGMEGVAEGVLDIGDASSASAVETAQSQYPTADLTAFEMGGSGVVAIVNGGNGGPLTTAGQACVEFTEAAMTAIFQNGYSTITCPANGIVLASDVVAGGSGCTAPTASCIQAVSRSDLPSGTEDTWCTFIGTGTNLCQTTSNNAQLLPGANEVGNPGVLAYVQKNAYTVGFVDLGFAEGASAEIAQSLFIPELTINNTAGVTPTSYTPTACSSGSVQITTPASAVATGAQNCYVANGQSTGNLHTYVGNGLSGTGTLIFPDYVNTAGATGLTRTFWMVTAGQPSAVELQFITYLRSPSATSYWNNQGYFSLYQITPLATAA